ncbi:TetR/AcrR family transcriptional regulator, partial [Parvibacter caecicola]
FRCVRFDRFRDDIDPKYVLDLLIWLADGYLHQQRALHQRLDMDAMLDEMYRWCDMLKAYSYKEEYR